jgi:hypothetical protein
MTLLGDGEVEEIKDDEEVVSLAKEFLLSADKKDDISLWYAGIIEECKNKKDYYFVRSVICLLELSVDSDKIVDYYDFNTMKISSIKDKSFRGLNSNIDETGIIILSKVKTLKALSKHANAVGEYFPRKNANDWLEDINNRLTKIYYIDSSKLLGYTIKNYLFSDPVQQCDDKEIIRIGVSPIIKKNLEDLLDIKQYYGTTSNGFHPTRLFGVERLLSQDLIKRRTVLAFERACAEKCDIFISPEMLGTDELLEIDDSGTSVLFRPNLRNAFQTPFLTLPPTQWLNEQNVLSVFNNQGEKIGEQHKQNKFGLKHDGAVWLENLKNPKKEILLIHINKWGRFAFPICMDFLTPTYRNILTDQIKATFLLCPSFSKGAYNFDLTSGNDSEFEVRSIWINSCSAYEESDTDYVGIVSVPTCLDRSRRIRIKPECGGECRDICLFVVDIPKDCNDKNKNVEVRHIYESE